LPYRLTEGDIRTALSQPNSVVINEDIAHKLFGNRSALNQVIRISSSSNGDTTFRITGVFAEPQSPTHMDARFFITFLGGNFDNLANNNPGLLNNNMIYTYVLLNPDADGEKLTQKFAKIVRRHLGAI